jgi:hypothetical protein
MSWPFALEYAIFIWNKLPKQKSGMSPEEIFSSVKANVGEIVRRLRIWGCPVYVLDPAVQDGKKLPKWVPCARRGMFLGFSTNHSSTVGRILNLVTGHISPQYHVVYDELLSTVTTTDLHLEALGNNSMFTLDRWNELITTGYDRNDALVEAEENDQPLPQLADEWLPPAEIAEREELRARRFARKRLLRSDIEPEPVFGTLGPLTTPPCSRNIVRTNQVTATNPVVVQPVPTVAVPPIPVVAVPPAPIAVVEPVVPPVRAQIPVPVLNPTEGSTETEVRTRGRRNKPNRKFFGEEWVNYQSNNGDSKQKI